MERLMSPEERIKRAEEIYYRRKNQGVRVSTTSVNIDKQRKVSLGRKMIIQLIICVCIYAFLFTLKNSRDNFSKQAIENVCRTLNYDINLSEVYKNCVAYVSSINFNNLIPGVLLETSDIEDNNEKIIEDNNSNVGENFGVEGNNALQNEILNNDITKSDSEKESLIGEMASDLNNVVVANQNGQSPNNENLINENNQSQNNGNIKNENVQEQNNENIQSINNEETINTSNHTENNSEENAQSEIGKFEYNEGDNKSQMEIDAEYVKQNCNIIPPLRGYITSGFGNRESTEIISAFHQGVDIRGAQGTEIHSAMDGKVVAASYAGDYGNHIKVQNGEVLTVYAHCSELCVNVGDYVTQGQVIGKVGATRKSNRSSPTF